MAVGTSPGGFDALVEAADRAAVAHALTGFAQIGSGSYEPRALACARFLPADQWRALLRERPLVVCHAGMGVIGDAMRAGCRIVAVPRSRPTGRSHLSNDQRAFLDALCGRYPIFRCDHPDSLPSVLGQLLPLADGPVDYERDSDVPHIVAAFLARGAGPR